MKMYVWEDVLDDYTSGMICVLARTKKHALEIIEKENGFDSYVYQEARSNTPIEVTNKSEQKCYFVYGGG